MTKTATAGLPGGVCIKVKFLGPTNHRGARYKATYRRDSEQVFSSTVAYDYSGESGVSGCRSDVLKAAQGVVDQLNKQRQEVLPGSDLWEIACHGWDHDHYYFVASCL